MPNRSSRRAAFFNYTLVSVPHEENIEVWQAGIVRPDQTPVLLNRLFRTQAEAESWAEATARWDAMQTSLALPFGVQPVWGNH